MAADRSRPLLVLGAGGQVGSELPRALSPLGRVVALDRAGADLSDPESLRGVVRRHRPEVIVNAAAYTAVDRGEAEPGLAHRVNVEAPGVLAEEAAALGAVLVHYSTDYVFDGTKPTPYCESDLPRPLSVYGRTKLAGERAVAAAGPRHLIFRTSWVHGVHGSNFLKTVLRLAAEREELRIVADQVGAPTPATLIADVTARAVESMLEVPGADARWGLYHLSSSGETSWHAYARYVVGEARRLGLPLRATPDSVVPISTAEYPAAAPRPASSRLDTTKVRSAFVAALPEWREGVDRVLQALQQQSTR